MSIAIQICSKAEWKTTLTLFNKNDDDLKNPGIIKYFEMKINSKNCIIYYSRASKTFASAACQYTINNFEPEYIINIGTAAKIKSNININDFIIANRTLQYDIKQLFPVETKKFYRPGIVGRINLPEIKINLRKHNIKKGTIASADHDLSEENIEYLRKLDDKILAADWESASISLVCRDNDIPCLILRGISDVPAGTDKKKQDKQYKKNTNKIIPNAFKLLKEIL
jgi:adenosylhomocysteine nucleosidase/adenosylhomocysteine/aminodeoxyfutalosine nucleosidase